MAVVPVLPAVTGGVYTTSQISALVAAVDFFQRKPAAELRQSVAQSIATSTWTSLLFDLEDLDASPTAGAAGKMHSTSVNPSRATAVYPGWYLLGGGYNPAVNAAGQRATRWAVNGTPVNGSDSFIPATGASGIAVAARVKRVFLNINDYVELQCWQNIGAPLFTAVAAEAMSTMTIGFDRSA